jgi:hypothetical protein
VAWRFGGGDMKTLFQRNRPMNWRDKRRRELLRLGVTDPALLTIRYYELVTNGDTVRPAAADSLPLCAIIDAILDEEEVLCQPASPAKEPAAADELASRRVVRTI